MFARFCLRCGTKLRRRLAFGHPRNVCPQCGYVHFDDPKLAVGVVAEWDGQIVLARRNHEPRAGQWSFPSGYVDAGEVLEEAAARETKEETGLDVRIDRLLGAWSSRGERVIFIAYAARVTGGRIEIGPECLEVRFFPPDALPPLAFPHDQAIVRAWRQHERNVRRASRPRGVTGAPRSTSTDRTRRRRSPGQGTGQHLRGGSGRPTGGSG